MVVEIVRVEMPDPDAEMETAAGIRDAEGPLTTTGETVPERITFPAKPLRLVSLTVVEFEEPAWTVRLVEVGEIVKSTMFTVTMACRTRPTEVALTVTM